VPDDHFGGAVFAQPLGLVAVFERPVYPFYSGETVHDARGVGPQMSSVAAKDSLHVTLELPAREGNEQKGGVEGTVF
jgi:hypothetical protein